MPTYLIGVDLGTTNWKAGLYRLNGTCHTYVKVPAPTLTNKEGSHYHPDQAWQTFCRLTARLLAQAEVPSRSIAGLGISSQAETGIPLDRSGRWIYPAITWFDPRTIPQRDWLDRHVGEEAVFQTTGLTLRHIFTLPKLLWLKQHRPSVHRRIAKWLWLPDFMGWKLTGTQATEYSIASRSMVFDIRRKQWDPAFCRVARLSPGTFPDPVPSGHLLGTVTHESSKRSRLPQGLPIFTGGHDHLCGAFAVGATQPGIMLDSIGTAESLLTSLLRPPAKGRRGYSVGCHVAKDRFYLMGGLYSAAASIEWLKKYMAPGTTYQTLIRLAQYAPPGPTGILFLPHLWGSSSIQSDPASQAALVRVHAGHTRAHLMKAVFEGLAYEADHMRHDVERLTRTRTKELLVIGASAKNPVWMDIKSNVSGLPLCLFQDFDAVTLGAAMLAGLGSGVYPDETVLRRSVKLPSRRIRPAPARVRAYQAVLPAYKKLYGALQSLDETHP